MLVSWELGRVTSLISSVSKVPQIRSVSHPINHHQQHYLQLRVTLEYPLSLALTMAVLKGACVAALAATFVQAASASSLQQPLLNDAQKQAPLLPSDSSATISSTGKPLVDSEKLQAAISGDKLYERSKELYKIAEQSLHEYNHPTRVIGSAGEQTAQGYKMRQ